MSFSFSDLGKTIGTIAGDAVPLLTNVLTGNVPGAAASVAGLIAKAFGTEDASPDALAQIISSDPQAAFKLAQLESNERITLAQLNAQTEQARIAAETTSIAAVNQTMQAEAVASANENWWQTGWRPFNGYVVGLASLLSVIAVFALAGIAIVLKDQTALNAIPVITTAVTTVLVIPGAAVGITAWHKGVLQREEVKSRQG
ncbi:MAG: 3TM-type holin [Parvibaculaceae bacterium]|nr:3TM-type holin [Parvibaculaceae bacterium]